MASIFVQITSYRDPECQHTIKDLFDQAEHPERIFVGVFWQCDKNTDQHCFEIPAPRSEQVQTKFVHHKDANGACWARAEAFKLYNNEDFVLQIDSHMRFAKGWDSELLAEYEQTVAISGHSKNILSNYVADYDLAGGRENFITVLSVRPIENTFRVEAIGRHDPLAYADQPITAAFVSGHFLFAPALAFQEVPYDPHIYFHGEEVSYAARLWTHGWDLFHPHRLIAFHLYNRSDSVTKNRVVHSEEDPNWVEMDFRSKRRVKHLLGIEYSDDAETIKELDQYRLGENRTLKDYAQFAGLDLARMETLPRCKLALYFQERLPLKSTLQSAFQACTHESFKPDKLWTKHCINWLLSFGAQRICLLSGLAPLPFIAALKAANLEVFFYPLSGATNLETAAHNQPIVLTDDPCQKTLPKSDAVLLLDWPTELSRDYAWKLLENASISQTRFIFLPTNQNLDISEAPFYFPNAQNHLKAYNGEFFGIWDLNEVKIFIDQGSTRYNELRSKLTPKLEALLGLLQQAFSNEPQIYELFLKSFLGNWETCNQLLESEPTISRTIKDFQLRPKRDLIFRLVYWCDLDDLFKALNFINEADQKAAQALALTAILAALQQVSRKRNPAKL